MVWSVRPAVSPDLTSSFTSPAVVAHEATGRTLVYQGSQSGAMSAYDADTGSRAWVFKIPSQIQSSPSVVNGVVYFGANDHNFYALNAGTGALICKADVGGVITIGAAGAVAINWRSRAGSPPPASTATTPASCCP